MELLHLDKRDGYIYDPVIKGYDTNFWSSIVGTPTVSGTALTKVLQFNSQSAASYLLHCFVDIEFGLTVPVAPTAGHSRQWGLIAPAQLNQGGAAVTGALYFDITGTAFTFKVVDNLGNVLSKTLTWAAGYTNTFTRFRIRWESDRIQVLINDVVVATVDEMNLTDSATIVQGIPKNSLPIYINNGVADNELLSYIQVRRAAAIV